MFYTYFCVQKFKSYTVVGEAPMQEHGSYEMKRQDQLIVITALYAFNKEGILKWAQDYKALVETIKDEPWACLCDITQWELFTPDAWDVIDEVNHWCNANNLKYLVFICDSDIELVQQDMLNKSHSVMTNVRVKFCDNIQEAYNWLDSLGFYHQARNT